MMIRLTDRVGQLVADRPARAAVFERLGIDYCCRGKVSLAEACQQSGLLPESVVAELDESGAEATGDETDWTARPLGELCDHIVTTHHDYLRVALPRIGGLLAKVVAAHGNRHLELHRVEEIFRSFSGEMKLHMFKEEQVLFPLIRRLDGDTGLPGQFTIAEPIGVMEREHDEAGAALEAMRRLTNGFTPPTDACPTYRVLMAALAELEADLHRHVHLENNVLFPRVAQMERSISEPRHEPVPANLDSQPACSCTGGESP